MKPTPTTITPEEVRSLALRFKPAPKAPEVHGSVTATKPPFTNAGKERRHKPSFWPRQDVIGLPPHVLNRKLKPNIADSSTTSPQ